MAPNTAKILPTAAPMMRYTNVDVQTRGKRFGIFENDGEGMLRVWAKRPTLWLSTVNCPRKRFGSSMSRLDSLDRDL